MKNIKKVLLFVCCLCLLQISNGQEKNLSSRKGESSLGFGMGLPYGGFGVNLKTNVADGFALFGGLGYQISGIGYNVGAIKDISSIGLADIYALGMYGTNAGIKIKGDFSYEKLYFGPSFGAGVRINSRQKEGNHWNMGLLVPIKSSSYKAKEKEFKNSPFIQDFTPTWDVLFYVGYSISL